MVEDRGAQEDEKCALCRSDMKAGATVCGHCGATRTVERIAGTLGQVMIILSMLCVPGGLLWVGTVGAFTGHWFGSAALIGWAIAVGPPILAFGLTRRAKPQVYYQAAGAAQRAGAWQRAHEDRIRRLH